MSIAKEYTEGFDPPPRNFFPSSLSVSLELAAGAFLEDMIPRNEFSFQVFATDYMVFVGAIYLITFKLKHT